MTVANSNTFGPVVSSSTTANSNILGPVFAVPLYPSFQYQTVPKLFSGPQKPQGLGPDPEMTGY